MNTNCVRDCVKVYLVFAGGVTAQFHWVQRLGKTLKQRWKWMHVNFVMFSSFLIRMTPTKVIKSYDNQKGLERDTFS